MNNDTIHINLPSIRVKGRYMAVVHTGHEFDEFGRIKKYGKVLRETPFGDNVITTHGFDVLLTGGTNNMVMVVGAGNTTPTEADGVLTSYLGKSNSFVSADTTKNVVPDGNNEVWWRMTKRVTFGPGSLGGGTVNVAEAGFTANVAIASVNASTPLASRGLLVDGVSAPTTVSLDNSVEYLDVIWEYTEYIKASAIGTVTMEIDGVNVVHDFEVRPYYFDNNGGSYNYGGWTPTGGANWPGWGPIGDSTYTWSWASNCFAEDLVAITGNGLGNGVRADIPGMTSSVYVNGDKFRDLTMAWIPARGNKNIRTVRVNLGHTSWQVRYDPVVAKVNTKQLNLVVRLSMANK